MRIIVTGDICPDENDEKLLIKGDVQKLFGNVLPILEEADVVITNLETVVCRGLEPNKKSGPCFCFDSKGLLGLRRANIMYFTLANNHIKDYGNEGIYETIKALDDEGMFHVGAGSTEAQAEKPIIITGKEATVSIIAAAENEGQIITDNHAGTMPIDLHKISKVMSDASVIACDYRIIILHGGVEFYRYPTPRMIDVSHELIKLGADCVIWHHSHCSSGLETYMGKKIYYGVGNFLFNYPIEYQNFYKSYFVSIDINKHDIECNIVPFYQHFNGKSLELMEGDERLEFEVEIEMLSNTILNRKMLKDKFDELSRRVSKRYLAELFGYGRIFKQIGITEENLDYMLMEKYSCSVDEFMKIMSMMNNESHREIFNNIVNLGVMDDTGFCLQ